MWLFNIFVCAVSQVASFFCTRSHSVIGKRQRFMDRCCWAMYDYLAVQQDLFSRTAGTAAHFADSVFHRTLACQRLSFAYAVIAAALSLVGAWLSKEAVIFAVPALLIVAFPAPKVNFFYRRLMTIFLIAVVIGMIGLLLLSIFASPHNPH